MITLCLVGLNNIFSSNITIIIFIFECISFQTFLLKIENAVIKQLSIYFYSIIFYFLCNIYLQFIAPHNFRAISKSYQNIYFIKVLYLKYTNNLKFTNKKTDILKRVHCEWFQFYNTLEKIKKNTDIIKYKSLPEV